MISKIYRLKEKDVKKVLKLGKPFFSYCIVLNYIKNNFGYNRYAIIISGKNVSGSVERNFFRRRFYKLIIDFQKISNNTGKSANPNQKIGYDLVFFVKKQTKLEKNNFESIKSFDNNISFLIKNINRF